MSEDCAKFPASIFWWNVSVLDSIQTVWNLTLGYWQQCHNCWYIKHKLFSILMYFTVEIISERSFFLACKLASRLLLTQICPSKLTQYVFDRCEHQYVLDFWFAMHPQGDVFHTNLSKLFLTRQPGAGCSCVPESFSGVGSSPLAFIVQMSKQ